MKFFSLPLMLLHRKLGCLSITSLSIFVYHMEASPGTYTQSGALLRHLHCPKKFGQGERVVEKERFIAEAAGSRLI
jgi:hypothetical protein